MAFAVTGVEEAVKETLAQANGEDTERGGNNVRPGQRGGNGERPGQRCGHVALPGQPYKIATYIIDG
eukprot:jgi/Tetstr1/425187/TSEL_015648.t1